MLRDRIGNRAMKVNELRKKLLKIFKAADEHFVIK